MHQALWLPSDLLAGDETIAKQKGKMAGDIRQYVARKPCSTGIKLYGLTDHSCAFTLDVYLYTGRLMVYTPGVSASSLYHPKGAMPVTTRQTRWWRTGTPSRRPIPSL